MPKVIGDRKNLRIKYGEYRNCTDVLNDIFRDYKREYAIKYMVGDEVIGVKPEDFFADIKNAAAELTRLGLYRKHIGYIGKNSYGWFTLSLAGLYAGCVGVPMSQYFSLQDVIEHADFADVEVMFYDEDLTEMFEEFTAKTGKKAYEFKKFIAGAYKQDRVTEDGTINNQTVGSDVTFILFTSGTTGKSKGVMLTNDAFRAVFRCSYYELNSLLVPIPFHHSAGLTATYALFGNACEIDIGEDPKRFVTYLTKMQSEATFVVPALLSVFCSRLKKANYDKSKLGWNIQELLCGAAAFPAGVLPMLESAGIFVEQFYGLTETAGGLIGGVMSEKNSTMIGNRVMFEMEADIIDGELVGKGPRVFAGYYKDEEATREVLIDGWFHTGDLARRDENGAWYLTGRKKNLIILANGENISPEEIETELNKCPDVDEVVVYGKDKFLHAQIFPACDQDASSEEKAAVKARIEAFVEQYNDGVPTFKMLPFVEFRDVPFEKNASGKIMRDKI